MFNIKLRINQLRISYNGGIYVIVYQYETPITATMYCSTWENNMDFQKSQNYDQYTLLFSALITLTTTERSCNGAHLFDLPEQEKMLKRDKMAFTPKLHIIDPSSLPPDGDSGSGLHLPFLLIKFCSFWTKICQTRSSL